MAPKTEYKTFTFTLDYPTLLDGFAPMYLEDIRGKFEPIETIKISYIRKLQTRINDMSQYELLQDVVKDIKTSNQHLEEIFGDFKNRIKYFTIMFFGTVNAGKTSMICDLSQSNPVGLTNIIRNNPNFDSETDAFVVGPNVATTNLYEILIERSGLRLVDIPGIGGVVHDNKSLAPFVDMADCIVFLIDSNNDITQNDYNFIVEHVSGIREMLNAKKHIVEEGNEKNMLVVLNKWENAHGKRPAANQQLVFEKKKNWILNGNEQKEFKGISELFSNEPIVVKATTAQRDEDTGEVFNDAEVEGVVESLREIFAGQGKYTRLKRPRKIMLKELSDMHSRLLSTRTSKAMEGMSKELGKYQSKIGVLDGKLKFEMPRSLGSVERLLTIQIHTALKKTMDNWQPDVGIAERFRLAVPQWAADFFNADNMGKKAVQKELKQVWETQFKDEFKKHLDMNDISTKARNEIKGLMQQMSLYFQAEFVDASPQLKEALLKKEKSKAEEKGFHVGDGSFSLSNSIEEAVKKVEDQVTSQVISLITVDAILLATLGAFLTPVGSLALIVGRRLFAKRREKDNVRKAMTNELYDAAQDIASKIRIEMETVINNTITDMTNTYLDTLSFEMAQIRIPLKMIDETIGDILEHKSYLEQLNFDEQ